MPRFLSLAEAVESTVRDGDTVAMEGFTHLIPHAAGHEVIRQQRKRLTLIRMTPDLIYDQLIGMGCADKVVFSWGGNPGVGSLHRFRDAVENGWPQPLAIEEHSHAAMANAYEAGAAGLPLRGVPRLHRRRPAEGQSEHQVASPVRSPASSSPPCRRIRPDVAIIHALARRPRRQRACSKASSACRRKRCSPPSARSSRSRRSSTISAPRSLNAVILPHWTVGAIAHVPGGAYPVLCAGLLQARQRLLHRLGRRSRASARRSSPG